MFLLVALTACTGSDSGETEDTQPPPDTGPFYSASADCGTRTIHPSLLRWPYVQNITTTTGVIAWGRGVEGAQQSGTLMWGADASTSQTAAATVRTIPGDGLDIDLLSAEMTGLEAGTEYCYKVEINGEVMAEGLSFRTAPESPYAPVDFTVIGDFGKGNDLQASVRDQMLQKIDEADLHLTVGDNAYSSGTWEEWQRNVFTVYQELWTKAPVYMVAGNHDWSEELGLEPQLANLFMPENATREQDKEIYWSMDWGPLHVVGLDTEKKLLELTPLDDSDNDMYEWLEADLAATDKPWKIAVFHHPPYSEDPSRGGHPIVATSLMPILQNHGVNLALIGHDHFYVRYWPLFDQAVASAENLSLGVTYVVSGGGGAEPREMEQPLTDDRVAYRESTNQFLWVHADFCTLEGKSIDLNGVEIDAFTINRCE